jgi:hypothetical protein
MARSTKVAWKRNAVTNVTDEDGLRKVNLPSLTHVGISNADRDAIFAFERPLLGTMRATIRINQRAQNHRTKERDGDGNLTGNLAPMKVLPKRLAESGPIEDGLRRFYDQKAIDSNGGVVPSEA